MEISFHRQAKPPAPPTSPNDSSSNGQTGTWVTLCHAKFGLVHFIEVHSPSLVVCLFLFSDLFIRKWLAAVKGVLFDGCEPFAIIMIQEKAACPCARFVQQGGAGGFACRSNSHG